MTDSLASAAADSGRQKIWDAPVRLFHWALVGLLGAAWWTAEERMIDWHRLTGYAILTLLLFRIVWGLAGSTTARFSSFLRGPGAVVSYLRKAAGAQAAAPSAGHNPLGGWSVVLMLGVLLLQIGLGLFAVDIDGMESGPFTYLVEFDTGRAAAEWHERIFTALQVIVAIHVLAIVYYLLVRRDNLIAAMITGSRKWAGERPALAFAPWTRAVLVAGGCAVAVWLVISLWGRA